MELKQKRRISLKNSLERPLTEQEIVEATIAAANGAELRLEGQGGAVGPDLVGAYSTGPRNRAKEVRAVTRDWLRLVVTDRAAAARQLLQQSGYWTAAQHPTRILRRTDEGLEVRLYEPFPSVLALLHLGALFLLDPSRPFGKRLCQCGWEPCGRFFFEYQPARGRPQRKYCRPGHMEKAHNEGSADRMEKLREKQRRAKHK